MAELYPAIDIRGGKVVRLRQGEYGDETVYGDDPVGAASGFADAGATWIHVVDLDAARSGDPANRPVVAAVTAAVADRAKVQTGGGVRTLDDVAALRDAGVSRVVMGSAAVRNPGLVEAASELLPVAVGLDHRGGELAIDGWTEASGVTVSEALGRYPAAAAFVITDIARDGMLAGPDVEGLSDAVKRTAIPVIASGGVGSLDDVTTLGRIDGLAGVITGKAIYEGRFDVAAALAALQVPR